MPASSWPGAWPSPARCNSLMLAYRGLPGRRRARVSPAATDPRRAATAGPGRARRDRRRHHADQYRDRNDHRFAAGRRRLLPLLCRPASINCRSASSASPSAWCCCRISRASCGPATCWPCRTARTVHSSSAAADGPGGRRPVRHGRADLPGPVRARRVHDERRATRPHGRSPPLRRGCHRSC